MTRLGLEELLAALRPGIPRGQLSGEDPDLGYDQAKTPYQQVLASSEVPEERKEQLRQEYHQELTPWHYGGSRRIWKH